MSSKYRKLCDILKRYENVAVAFSGGVDSSLLLKAATDVFAENAIAFFAHSALQKKDVLPRVEERCRFLGARLQIVSCDPFAWPEFVANRVDRCYQCKKNIYGEFIALLPEGYTLLDGTNVDDLSMDRPGFRAITEYGVTTPLVDAGFSKSEVRGVSRDLGLSWWDLPSDSCLATRVARGLFIRHSLLQLVEAGEGILADNGFVGSRVKIDESAVFVKLAQNDQARFVQSAVVAEMASFFTKHKITKFFLDLSEQESIVF